MSIQIKNLMINLRKYRVLHSHGHFFPQYKNFLSDWKDVSETTMFRNVDSATKRIQEDNPLVKTEDIPIVNDPSMR